MAQLFHLDSGKWRVVPLDRPAFRLTGEPAHPVAVASAGAAPLGPSPLLFRFGSGGVERWAIMSPASVPVRRNGRPLFGGLALLAHGDALQLRAAPPVYFSSELIASVQPFPGGQDDVVACPRCRVVIEPGSPAARCESCSLWFHQTEALPCYTVSACICGGATVLDGELTWSPEQL